MNEKKQSLLGGGEEVRAVCTPDSGAAGAHVTITTTPASEPSGFHDLTILGGVVISLETGLAEKLDTVEAMEDANIYTAVLPNDLDEGHYDIIIDLTSHLPGKESTRFTIKANYEVEGNERGKNPEIRTITPSTISQAEFNTKLFTVQGKNFDQLNVQRGAQILTEAGVTRLSVTPQSDTRCLIRTINQAGTPPSAGVWAVFMFSKSGIRISSASRIRVTEEE